MPPKKHQSTPTPATAAAATPPDIPPWHPLQVTVPEPSPSPSPRRCVAYMDLTREECGRLFPSGRLRSQPFRLDGRPFFLSARCNMDQRNAFHCFGLFLAMDDDDDEDDEEDDAGSPASVTVEYEFAARTSASSSGDEFVSRYKGYYTFAGGKACGYRDLLGTPWTSLMAAADDDSIFFVDGVLRLRAELSVKELELI
ncbi:BTB/POZ domain-containing protein POB1-like [Oryza brachyantha]|nr:BTB/POZ domain-containing protein POB1-like [Oryza brachyantha]